MERLQIKRLQFAISFVAVIDASVVSVTTTVAAGRILFSGRHSGYDILGDVSVEFFLSAANGRGEQRGSHLISFDCLQIAIRCFLARGDTF